MYRLGADSQNKHMEDFYYWVMEIVPDNYLLWRVCIWLPAAVIIAIFLKLLGIPPSIATTFFFAFALTRSYYYTRNVLALSVLYLALTFFILRTRFVRKTLNIILCVGLMFASWFFHRSMPLYILIGLIALFMPFNRKYLIVASIAFPLLYGVLYTIALQFLSIEGIWVEADTGMTYLDDTNTNTSSRNWKGMLGVIVDYMPVVYFYIVAFWKALPRNCLDYSYYKVFLLYSSIVVYVSLLFVGQGADAVHHRLYASSMLPFIVVVSLFFKNNFMSKECRILIQLLLFKYFYMVLFILTRSARVLY